jgi:hypothetical protein
MVLGYDALFEVSRIVNYQCPCVTPSYSYIDILPTFYVAVVGNLS